MLDLLTEIRMVRIALPLAVALAATAAPASTLWQAQYLGPDVTLSLRGADLDDDGFLSNASDRAELIIPTYYFARLGDQTVCCGGSALVEIALQQPTVESGDILYTVDGVQYDFATEIGAVPLTWTQFVANVSVPLPATAPLVLAGLGGLYLAGRRRSRVETVPRGAPAR